MYMPLVKKQEQQVSSRDFENLIFKLSLDRDYSEKDLDIILNNSKYLTREHLSKIVGIEDYHYYIHEDASDIALKILSDAEKHNSICEKLDSALLTEWARKLIVDRYDWEYEVADYIFSTPKFIKIFNSYDLKDLFLNEGDAGYLGAWPDIENSLLKENLINQFFKADNESLQAVLEHLNSSAAKEIIEKELKRRDNLCSERKSSSENYTFNVSSFFQQFEKTPPINPKYLSLSRK